MGDKTGFWAFAALLFLLGGLVWAFLGNFDRAWDLLICGVVAHATSHILRAIERTGR